MTWTFRHISALLLPLLVASRGLAAPCDGTAHAPGDLGIDLSQQDQCDPLVPEHCLLPFPNDYHSVLDGSTKTHRRLHFVADALPKNTSGTPMDANELNQRHRFTPLGAAHMEAHPRARALAGTAAH